MCVDRAGRPSSLAGNYDHLSDASINAIMLSSAVSGRLQERHLQERHLRADRACLDSGRGRRAGVGQRHPSAACTPTPVLSVAAEAWQQ